LSDSLNFWGRLILRIETFMMTRLTPLDRPGPFLRYLFKVPLFFYKINLPLFNDFILLLTTTGRKSGQARRTALEYRREPESGYAIITAGWGGKTDWRRNLRANPRVKVQIGRNQFVATAEALPDEHVAAWLAESLSLNPRSTAMFSRWAGEPVGLDDHQSLLRAAKAFPSYRLVPRQES
jgi:deazaflavin-dependent oxidoreductase (nitroreductase family)